MAHDVASPSAKTRQQAGVFMLPVVAFWVKKKEKKSSSLKKCVATEMLIGSLAY